MIYASVSIVAAKCRIGAPGVRPSGAGKCAARKVNALHIGVHKMSIGKVCAR